MVVKTNGYTNKTPTRYVMDAGAVYKDFVSDGLGGFTGTLLGATEGGNEFVLEQETREVEVDGIRGRVVGGTILVREDASLTVNLKEQTADNIALAIAGGVKAASVIEGYESVTGKGKIDLEDYSSAIALVARITGNTKPVIIILKKVLSLEGLTFKTEDDGETVIAITLGAHKEYDEFGESQPHYEILWPTEVV